MYVHINICCAGIHIYIHICLYFYLYCFLIRYSTAVDRSTSNCTYITTGQEIEYLHIDRVCDGNVDNSYIDAEGEVNDIIGVDLYDFILLILYFYDFYF